MCRWGCVRKAALVVLFFSTVAAPQQACQILVANGG
jgi:hypothetical protein